MGNICHAPPVLGSSGSEPAPPSPLRTASVPRTKSSFNFGRDPTLKREDYVFSNGNKGGPTCLFAKLPGSINGQQFIIENCSDCDIFLLDNCTSVQIDDCTNCRIVVGPCESSLFLRNCKSCTVVCAVQQFRTRDCDDMDIFLYSSTEPIIELSSKMRFACFPLSYFSMQQQFDKAKFSVWNNKWSEIYNFTPDHGTWKPRTTLCHESPLAAIITETTERNDSSNGALALWKMPSWTCEELGLTITPSQLVVPLTSGLTPRRDSESCLVAVFATPVAQLMLAFAHEMVALPEEEEEQESSGPVLFLRSKQIKLTLPQAKALFPATTNQPLQQKAVEAAQATMGSVVMEFQGASCYARLQTVLTSPKFAGESAMATAFMASTDTATARRMCELVFHEWKETI